MNGYDTYDIEWRQYYPALMRFQTPDPEAEEYYSISPYAMCEDNTVKNIDPDGRDGWDVIQGIGEAFLDDANPNPNARPLSNSSNPKNQTHYTIGQTIGHVVAAVTGAYETIEGGGTALGGASLAVAGSEFVATVPVGTAIAVAGATEAAHGMMMMLKAVNGSKNQKNQVSDQNSNKTNKPANQTYSGHAADEHGNKLGPSGKPQVNKVQHSTQKSAKNAARNEGKGAPIKHPNPKKGEDHYHSTDKNGDKNPNSTHHEY
jgi:hypothetical protein